MNRARLPTGITLAYAEAGPPDGEPLLLQAPLGRDHSFVAARMERYSQRFRCIAPDYRGTGASESPEDGYTIRQFAADSAALLDHLGIEDLHVAGTSMGAAVAMELAVADPTRVRSLSLYTPWGRSDVNLRQAFGFLHSLVLHAPPEDVERAISWLIFTPGHLERSWSEIERLIQVTIRDAGYPSRRAYAGHFEASIEHDALDGLSVIESPALVLAGEMDRFIPPRYAEEVCDEIRGCSYRLLRGPGSGHAMAIEREADAVQAGMDFLLEVSRA